MTIDLLPDAWADEDRFRAAWSGWNDPPKFRRAFLAARRLANGNREVNWVFAMELYGLGSTFAREACARMGLDPEAIGA